ncbi:unnamed protein product [Diatraea saccharalis]|uniref:Alpha N-terminal protein methyltransferase 1 n=1 Tax=Diatraea saccharalis TaxID=40085 RepID=A0A9N9WCU6_9NEOP|nr:unnamed protein product [Diatraea saccharalis]
MTESNFYKSAQKYWADIPATVDGVLGGYGYISDIDIKGSREFLDNILALDKSPARNIALDCGAGIGRITKTLLIPRFQKVDMVEQDEKFVNTAKQLIGKDNNKLGTVYKIGLQHFKPQKTYDVIWCQWVLGHLKDYDLIAFLERCTDALSKNGVIVVKENISTSEEIEYDDDDSSVTRPLEILHKIFGAAKLKILKTSIQAGFPEDIYPVHSFALVPEGS